MFKVNNKDTRTMPGVVQVSLLLTYFTLCSSVPIINFDQVNVDWESQCRINCRV